MRWRHRLGSVSLVAHMSFWKRIRTGTIVVGIQHGKEGANSEDIVVLRETRHLDWASPGTDCAL